ncbi:MAG TPA: hypothetical protein VF979_04055 [Streptosporangiaceae bacterium]
MELLTANADGAVGGNPAFSPFLSGPTIPPNPNEAGWKDVVKTFPGFVNRFVIRWAPQAVAVGAVRPGQNLFSFDPTPGLSGALPHPRSRRQRDDAAVYPDLVAS